MRTKTKRLFFVVLAALLFLGGATCVLMRPNTATASWNPPPPAEGSPSPQFLAAALSEQVADCGSSIEVSYSREFNQTDDPGSRLTYTCRYVRTPEALRLDMQSSSGLKLEHSYDRTTEEGRIMQTTSSRAVANVKPRWLGVFATQDVLETALFPLYPVPGRSRGSAFLADQIQNGVVTSRQSVDGHSCWRVEIPAPAKYTGSSGFDKYVVLLDPDAGFCPQSIQIPWNDKKPTTITFKDYTQVGEGVWFPKEQVIESSDGTHDYVTVNTVKEVHLGRAIPKAELLLNPSSGTKTTSFDDTGAATEYVVP